MFILDSYPTEAFNFALESCEGWLHSLQAIACIAHSLAQPLSA